MIRTLLVTVLLVALAGCAAQTSNKSKSRAASPEVVQRQLDLGVGYLRQGDYQRAKEKLTRALQIDPENAMVHATFGLLFQIEGETELAEEYFRKSIKYDSSSAQARNSYGAFLFSQQRYKEAVVQLEAAVENRFYQNRPTVFENLGVAYLKLGDVEKAEYAFTRAVQLNPEQAKALLELADIRFDERQYVDARSLYQRHVKIASKTPRALWLCIRLARVFKDNNEEASCAQVLEGIYPATDEYRYYKESL